MPSGVKQLFGRQYVFAFVTRLLHLVLLLFSTLALGQLPPGVIDRLSVRTLGNKVQVEVTLSAGYTCNGIVITRSTDSLTFETVGLIGGVCGDSAAAVSYSFIDSFPPTNKRLHYQLLLGGRLATDTRQVVVYDFTTRPMIISPNPAKDGVEIRFEAAVGSNELITLTNQQGVEVLRVLAEDGWARFSMGHLPAGMYFVGRASSWARQQPLLLTK